MFLYERYDSVELQKLFNKYKEQGYSPLWVDPYCEFVCNLNSKAYRFTQLNNGKLCKEPIEI